MERTTLGFEIRTVGANPHAARYAGMRPIFITALTMTISGLLAGLAGAIQILGVIGFYAPGITASVGFERSRRLLDGPIRSASSSPPFCSARSARARR